MLVGRRMWAKTAGIARFRPQEVYQGLGLYETVGCQDGQPLLWQAHAARFSRSAQELFASSPELADEGAVRRLLLACGFASGPAALRVVWFYPRRAAVVWATRFSVPRTLRERGAHLTTALLPAHPLTPHKTTSVGPAQVLHRQALAAGFDGVLFYDHQRVVRETATANIFAVFDGEVLTPPAPPLALPGVLRGYCMASLREQGWPVREAHFCLEELLACEGAFLTSSLSGIVPVRAIDGQPLPFPAELFRVFQRGNLPVPGNR